MSREIPLNKHFLCVSLNLSLPATFHVKVDLVTNSSLTTVYNVDNVGEMVETDMLTVFEVKVNAEETVCQLMVEVSEGTIIRNIDIQNDNCHTSGRFVICYSVAIDWRHRNNLHVRGHIFRYRVISLNLEILRRKSRFSFDKRHYSMSQKITPPPATCGFLTFFTNG